MFDELMISLTVNNDYVYYKQFESYFELMQKKGFPNIEAS